MKTEKARIDEIELKKSANMFKSMASTSLDEEKINLEQREHLQKEMEQETTAGLASIARYNISNAMQAILVHFTVFLQFYISPKD